MKKEEIIKHLKQGMTEAEKGKENTPNHGYAYAYGILSGAVKSLIIMLED